MSAMAAVTATNTPVLTSCPSCGGAFTHTGDNQPVIITCGDTFCRRCVHDLTDSYGTLVCPCCGEVNDDENPESHSVNRLALSLISQNPSFSSSSSSFSPKQPHSESCDLSESNKQPSANHSTFRSNSSDPSFADSMPYSKDVSQASNHDVCGSCQKDLSGRNSEELQHCPHCGKAVCAVCKGEHKMLVLDRLHSSRIKIQEKMEDMRFSQQYKKETLSQLKLQGDAEKEKIETAVERAKALMIEELDKRKDALVKEVSNYVTNTVMTLETQLDLCGTAVSDVESRLDKVNVGVNSDSDKTGESEVADNGDLLHLCQTQITYARCMKILENCNKGQPEVKATMLKFTDTTESVNLLNLVQKYGTLKGSAALETNLKAAEELFNKTLSSGSNTQTKRLHRYRTIVGGSPLSSVTYRSNESRSAAEVSNDSAQTATKGPKNPEFLCVLKDDRVAVTSLEHSALLVFEKNLESKEVIKIDQFHSLKAITSTNSKLVVLLRNSLELYSLETLRVSGKFFGSSELVNPVTLAASSNRIFVYDQDRDRNLHYIAMFDAQGRYMSKKFVSESRCDLSTTLSVVKGKGHDDTLLVIGSCKSVFLKVVNISCEPLWDFNLDEPKIQGRKWRPYDTSADNEGNFLVVDSSGRKVLVFNKEGRFSTQFDPLGLRPGHVSKIGVNSEGQVLLLDTSHGKLLVF